MHGENRLNIKTQLIIGTLKLAESPDYISIDYGSTNYHSGTHKCIFPYKNFFHKICEGPLLAEALGQLPSLPIPKSGPGHLLSLIYSGSSDNFSSQRREATASVNKLVTGRD